MADGSGQGRGEREGQRASLTPTSYLVLGLVGHLGEATSYELKRAVAETIGGFWSVPHSQLYAEPARLVGVGLLHELQETTGRRRRTYTLTAEGRGALDRWLASPTDEGTELRDQALLKLYFGGQAGEGAVAAFAAHAATVHRERLAAYEAMVSDPPPRVDLHQLSILALAARYEAEAVAFWDAVKTDPDLAGVVSAVAVADIEAATAGVLARLADRTDADAKAASRLPGWAVGHVLTHVARNADAFCRVAADRRAGRTGTMYPTGAAGRINDIEAGSTRPMAELLEDIAESSSRFADAWRDPVPDGPCRSWEGIPLFPAAEIPLRRLREVEVHAVDTGLPSLDRGAWTDAYVEADLPGQWAAVPRRTTDAVHVVDDLGRFWSTGEPERIAPVTVDRRDLLAWLLDRHHADGLPALLAWGAPDTWRPAP